MKKFIRIFSIMLFMLFIIFTFGITISNAYPYTSSYMRNFNATTYSVNGNTSADSMMTALGQNKNLTGISGTVKNSNPYIFCRQRYLSLWSGTAVYEAGIGKHYANYQKYIDPITYPGVDKDEEGEEGYGEIEEDELTNESNVYAKAYIFANTTFSKDEKQVAWWHELGSADANSLNTVADEYQNYKNNDDFTVTNKAGEEVIFEGDNAVYGPIVINYNYVKASNNEEWGGFNYAFFDENNAKMDIDVINLCTKNGNTYTKITSDKITQSGSSNGYYKVTDTTYNGIDLYIVTTSKNVSSARLVIQSNKVEYIATVQYIYGERHLDGNDQVLCYDCEVKKDLGLSARQAIDQSTGAKTTGYTANDGLFYTYVGETEETTEALSSAPTNLIRLTNGSTVTTYNATDSTGQETYATAYEGWYSCSVCDSSHYNDLLAPSVHWERVEYDSDITPTPLESSAVSLLGGSLESSNASLLGAVSSTVRVVYRCKGCSAETETTDDMVTHIKNNHMIPSYS